MNIVLCLPVPSDPLRATSKRRPVSNLYDSFVVPPLGDHLVKRPAWDRYVPHCLLPEIGPAKDRHLIASVLLLSVQLHAELVLSISQPSPQSRPTRILSIAPWETLARCSRQSQVPCLNSPVWRLDLSRDGKASTSLSCRSSIPRASPPLPLEGETPLLLLTSPSPCSSHPHAPPHHLSLSWLASRRRATLP